MKKRMFYRLQASSMLGTGIARFQIPWGGLWDVEYVSARIVCGADVGNRSFVVRIARLGVPDMLLSQGANVAATATRIQVFTRFGLAGSTTLSSAAYTTLPTVWLSHGDELQVNAEGGFAADVVDNIIAVLVRRA